MGLRGWLKRLERDARGELASFILEDGSRHYYYNPDKRRVFPAQPVIAVARRVRRRALPGAARDDKSPHKRTQQSRSTGGNLWWWRSFARSVPL